MSESLQLVNQGEDEMPFADIPKDPSLEDHPHCKEVVERLKGMEAHIQWLTSNIQSVSMKDYVPRHSLVWHKHNGVGHGRVQTCKYFPPNNF